MAEPTVTGLSSNDPVPGLDYVEVNFAQGDAALGQTEEAVLLMGLMNSSGSATFDTVVYGPNTEVQAGSQEQVDSLFGRGSMLSCDYRRFRQTNPTTTVYLMAVSGSSGAAFASGSISVTNAVTGSTAVDIYIEDEVISVGLADGTVEADACAEIVNAINAVSHLPVVASVSSNDVKLLQKTPGSQGNFTRFSARLKGSAGGFSIGPTASTLFTGGTGDANNAAALASIADTQYYTIVSGLQDQANLVRLKEHIETMALATTNKRQRAIAGAVGTLAATTTIANAINSPRAEIVWLEESDVPPSRMAAELAAIYTLGESSFPAATSMNFNGRPTRIKPPRSGATTSRSEEKAALQAGITPLKVNKIQSKCFVSKRVTTRSLNGTAPDYRIRDAHKVYICDRYANDLMALFLARYSECKVTDDPAQGANKPGRDVATPSRVKDTIFELLNIYGSVFEALQKLPQTKAATECVRSAFNSGRISCRIPLYPIDILDQLVTRIDQVG